MIGYLNGDTNIVNALQAWRESGTVLFISSVSAIEALSLSSLTASDVTAIENFLSDFIVIPVDMQIVRTAGALRREHRLSVPDAAIIATATANNLPLATRDKKMRAVSGIMFAEI